jgi:hypothetical protein
MAPLDDLLTALQTSEAQKQQIAASNPYTPAANIFGQLGTTIATSGPQYSLRDKLIYGAVSGMLGGALTGLADRRNQNAQAAYTDVVRRTLAGETNIQRPDELPLGLFDSGIQAGQTALFKRDLLQQQAEQELQRDLQKTASAALINKAVESPAKAARAAQGLAAILPGVVSAKVPSAAPVSEMQLQTTGAEALLDPKIKQLIDERNAIADVTDDSFANKVIDQKLQEQSQIEKDQAKALSDSASMVDSLRKEVNSLDAVKKFGEVSERYNVLKNALADPASISDLDFIYGVSKVLDPTSVVRESEGQMVIDSQAIDASILGKLNKAISGGGALSPTQRVDLLRLANRHYSTLGNKVADIQSKYTDLAKGRNLKLEELALTQPFKSTIPTDSAQQAQFLQNLAARFPPTEEGRAAFKEAVQLMGQ